MNERICHFCGFTAFYNDFPDGTIVYLGICACSNCLQADSTIDFKEIIGELANDEDDDK